MTNRLQQRISKIRLGAPGAALTLVVVLVLGVVTTQSAQAQTFTVLYSFTGGTTDGANPYGGLVRDSAGNLYGATSAGGSSSYGVVFKLDTSGTETVLHSFAGGSSDGVYPFGGLVRDTAGNLYGTTLLGGTSGNGTVFKVSKTKETVLHSFAGGAADGSSPNGGLIRDKKGNLYGTTEGGGASSDGTVFKVSKTKETVLHSFAGGTTDGASPQLTSLLMDKKGNLYGVAFYGGTSGYGVVYALSKSGTLTVLHSFTGGTTDGCYPFGTPAMDKMGNLYGTTEQCGSSNGGIVWKLSHKGTETVLHSFAGGTTNGADPLTGVILDAKVNLYGVTEGGGASSIGTVYKLSKTGTLTLLHSFAGSDGSYPVGGLMRDAKGTLYGTSVDGGSSGFGTVWKIAK